MSFIISLMKKSILVSILACSLVTASSLRSQDADGFVPLFNGKDLSGWSPRNVAADTFRWENGMVITTGVPTGFMATNRMYENFIVELDWQHMKEGGNSGVFIWGEGLPACGSPFARGIEVQVLDLGYEKQHPDGANKSFTSHGDIFPIWGATMTPMGRIAAGGNRSFPIENRVKPSPEWNHYRVECNNGEIRLSVNGKEVTVGKDCVPRKGYLCLESEGSEAHYKNVRIKELPSSNTPLEQTNGSYEGFKQLFNGKDLGGWKVTDDVKPFWGAAGAFFKAKEAPEAVDKHLWTGKEYGDCTLCVDWRLSGKAATGESGIYLRGDKKAKISISARSPGSGEVTGYPADEKLSSEVRAAFVPKLKADNALGKWNRYFITVKGDRVTVKLNDQIVIENAQLPGLAARGAIGLQHHGDAVEFGNIYIKEL